MKVSRREFVSTAGCATAASLCALPSFGFFSSNSVARIGAECTVLDLESNCALPESLAGMRTALGGAHRTVTEVELGSAGHVVVVPAAGTVPAITFGAVAESLARGATVLWESGAAFLSSRDFAQQQALTLEYFEISMGRPIDVWSQSGSPRAIDRAKNQSARNMRAIGHARVPYIAYGWPHEARVRDFSRVIPVSAENGRAIAHWGEIPVGWSRVVGAGKLVFLGSPIGPALRAGDSDAASLLGSLIAV
jgi:hypothetical protein